MFFVSKVWLPDQILELEEHEIPERSFPWRCAPALDPFPYLWQHREEWGDKGAVHLLPNPHFAQGTEDTELTLTREGDYIGSTDDNVEEINIFEGQFNRITFEQVYTKTFKCTYQLQLYPFDTQVNAVGKDWWRSPRFARWTWLWGSWRPQWWRSPQTLSPWSRRRCSLSISSPTGQSCKNVPTVPTSWCYFFSAGANFWPILGHFWATLAIWGHFWANSGNFG